jgi:DNA-binding NtrC family response regulator
MRGLTIGDETDKDFSPTPTTEREPLASLSDVERRHIERVLEEVRWNQQRAAKILGISRWSLQRRLRKYGMHRPGPVPRPQ